MHIATSIFLLVVESYDRTFDVAAATEMQRANLQ